MEPNLFDDNIDIFADLTVKPKEKSRKKVEAKSVFDDDTGEYGFPAPVSMAVHSAPRASLSTTVFPVVHIGSFLDFVSQ